MTGEAEERKRIAQQLPFLVRAWWLREFRDSEELVWRTEGYITSPVWSAHTDPMCDMAGLDYSYESEDD